MRIMGIFAIVLWMSSSIQAQTSCTSDQVANSRLTGGTLTQVSAQQPLSLYTEYATSSEITTTLENGTSVWLIAEPVCAEALIWWPLSFSVDNNIINGWVVETQDGEYVLEPISQTIEVRADHIPITADNLGNLERVTTVEYGWPLDLAWSSDSANLAISTPWAIWIHAVSSSQAEPLRLPPIISDPFGGLGALKFNPDNQTLLTAGIPYGELNTWSLPSGEILASSFGSPDYSGVAAISADGTLLASANWDGSIELWTQEADVKRLEGHTLVGALAFSPDGNMLISRGGAPHSSVGSRENTLRFWDVASGEQLAIFDLPQSAAGTEPRGHLAISSDGTKLATSAFIEGEADPLQPAVYLFDIRTQQMTRVIEGVGGDGDLTFTPDGRLIVIAAGNILTFYDVSSGQKLDEFTLISSLYQINRIALSPDGSLLAISHEGGTFPSSQSIDLWAIVE